MAEAGGDIEFLDNRKTLQSFEDDIIAAVLHRLDIANPAEASDLEQGRVLESWYVSLLPFYGDKILPVDLEIAERWGQLGIRQPLAVADGLIAASALVHDFTLATRNTSDFEPHGVRVVNPFL